MNVFGTVKTSINTREAIEHYGIDVNRYGKALCPFHNDRHPSLFVDDDHYYARFLCFGNRALTALHDQSDGFFRRQIVLTTKDRPAERTDDPFLVEKLMSEMEGIFLWCLEGLHRLLENNYQFTISGQAIENVETVKRSSNNVIEFLQSEGYIRFKADSEASSKALYEAYKLWCEDNVRKPM